MNELIINLDFWLKFRKLIINKEDVNVMKKRKYIAVIIFDIHDLYQSNMLKGLLEQVFFLDMNVSILV